MTLAGEKLGLQMIQDRKVELENFEEAQRQWEIAEASYTNLLVSIKECGLKPDDTLPSSFESAAV